MKIVYLALGSFGVCEVYTSPTDVCSDSLRLGIDYVYTASGLGTQSNISETLNKDLASARAFISTHDEDCIELVLQLVCAYYLPSCGNATHPHSPSSICQEECTYVQQSCLATWQAAGLAFRSMEPFLSCDDTSHLLHPISHCCTGAGIQLPTPSTCESYIHTPNVIVCGVFVPTAYAPSTSVISDLGSIGVTASSLSKEPKIVNKVESVKRPNDGFGSLVGVVTGAVGGFLLLLVAAVVVLLTIMVCLKRRKRKQLQMIALDIMAV